MKGNRSPLLSAGLRQARFFLTLLLCYLLQVSVIPYLRFGGVTPNLLLIVMAVSIVCLGRLRGLWAGVVYGVLLEVMMPTLRLLNLILYPASALFAGLFFANKTERRMEMERSQNKAGRNLNDSLRVLLCTLALAALFEAVNLVYVYLGGNDITGTHLHRSLTSLWMTVLPAIPVGWLLRLALGFPRKASRKETADHPSYS